MLGFLKKKMFFFARTLKNLLKLIHANTQKNKKNIMSYQASTHEKKSDNGKSQKEKKTDAYHLFSKK